MRILLVGGGETIETVYFLAKHFDQRRYRVTVVDPNPAETLMLSRRLRATVVLGDGSDPAVLEEAGARRADVVLSLASYDPDNLAVCQIAQILYGVPRVMALVNDPDNEAVFHQLGVTLVFSATRLIGSLIEGHTLFDEITHLFPAAEGQVHVTDIELDDGSPAVGQRVQDLGLPDGSLVAGLVRGGKVEVPRGDSLLQVADHLILIVRPDRQDEAIRILMVDVG